jgi:hypothetical protein
MFHFLLNKNQIADKNAVPSREALLMLVPNTRYSTLTTSLISTSTTKRGKGRNKIKE